MGELLQFPVRTAIGDITNQSIADLSPGQPYSEATLPQIAGSGAGYALLVVLDEAITTTLTGSTDLNEVYDEILETLKVHGFYGRAGTVFFAEESMNSVQCVLSMQVLLDEMDWLPDAISTGHLLRVDEVASLRPVYAP
jgi:virulence-associated protein VapD